MDAHPRREIIRALIVIYGSVCFYCKEPLAEFEVTIDHYVPRAAGGKDHMDNLRPACWPCNNDKADRIPLPDGSLPPKVTKQRALPKSERPGVCINCQNGRLLRADEWCPHCETGPQPPIRPRYLKKRTWECDHLQHWCVACCLYTDDERLEMAVAAESLQAVG